MATHQVRLKSRREIAEGTMAFHFEKPPGFTFKAGQALACTLIDPPETDDEGSMRNFSIASAPVEPDLMIATRMRDSAFKRVLKTMPLGTEVRIVGPFGSLTLHENTARPAVFLAGGIGITPFRSMLRQAAEQKLPHRLSLFYSNRRPEDAAFLEELQDLEKVVEIAVAQRGLPDTSRLEVIVSGSRLTSGVKSSVTEALDRLLGLTVNLSGFYRLAAADRRLGALAERFRGLKPPRFPTMFEALANGIACQQVTLTLGIRLLNRLAENHGAAITGSHLHAFPQPSGLAGLEPERLRKLKFSRQKARALIELSDAVLEGELDLEELALHNDEAAVARLQQLWGVGRWTAEYALLRGLGRLHVFPGDDVGARNNLQRWLRLKKTLDYEGLRHALIRWEPYGG